MNILIACEESQRVCKAFRDKGHSAFSCDIIECSGGRPEWHIQNDVIPLINGFCTFRTGDGKIHKIFDKWDMIIAFPPCTYLTVTGNRWYNEEKYGEKAVKRKQEREKAVKFFMSLTLANCDKIAIENPVGIMSTLYRKPDQIIQPYLFGDEFEKKTCLWLKGLSKLKPTKIVTPPERVYFSSGKSMAKWYSDLWGLSKEERAKERSKTFPGIARAMAEQWT